MPDIHQNYSLTPHNTLQLTASCAAYSHMNKLSELPTMLSYAAKHKLCVIPLGDGSNVVLADLPSTFIVDVALKGISIVEQNKQSIRIKVMAGENWHNLVSHCVAMGWYGIENLALIPGRVGAAPVQNIGAYGIEVSELISQVNGVNINSSTVAATENMPLEEIQFTNDKCYFGYRESVFKHNLRDKFLITSVELTLSKQFKPKLGYPALKNAFPDLKQAPSALQVMNTVMAIRSSKLPDPAFIPNAGSFFKNPVISQNLFKDFIALNPDAPWYTALQQTATQLSSDPHYKLAAGWLIEQCGFKGLKQGALAMHEQQALILTHCINDEQAAANAKQVLDFAKYITESVEQRFGIRLEIEPRCY